MITQIRTSKDAETFAKQIISEGVSFHPDDDFNDYVVFKTGVTCYNKQQAKVRNKLMNKCFQVCEKEDVDIYSLMLEVSLKETGMDKFIPLPSKHFAANN